ncbi:MAG: hypothetical protein M5R42_12940 [Rhodocyclaceae bacterium]|nr:hypothetical protein [Rhodocyclaceae bacterium]
MARLRYALILVTALLAPSAAFAEQTITFKVPVQLSNLYADVKKFSVGCTLRNKANPLATYAFDRTDLEVNKSYSGTVSVTVNVPDSLSPPRSMPGIAQSISSMPAEDARRRPTARSLPAKPRGRSRFQGAGNVMSSLPQCQA